MSNTDIHSVNYKTIAWILAAIFGLLFIIWMVKYLSK